MLAVSGVSDAVQVLLQTDPTRPDRYRFTVGADGRRFADWPAVDHPLDVDWQAAAQVREKGYTVELAVPFVGLGLRRPMLFPEIRS